MTGTAIELPSAGSSPHARGTPKGGFMNTRPCRLIPACAGNTRELVAGGALLLAHPRMRGEHYYAFGIVPVFGRLIPACAGNTVVSSAGGRLATAHPRMRGEHSGRGHVAR